MPYVRHFRKTPQTTWQHHRSGWGFVVANIDRMFSDQSGRIKLEGFVDGYFRHRNPITEQWVGFIHNVPKHPSVVQDLYPNNPDLSTLITLPSWDKSIKHCRGLYVLSDYVKDFLAPKLPVPVEKLYHPTPLDTPKFSYAGFQENQDKRILSIGHWLRNYESFEKLRSPYRNVLIKPYRNLPMPGPLDVEIHDWVDHQVYDQLLQKNVVFIHLYDASANNVIVECIARHTPILVNPLPAVREYLGDGYPLYFTNLDEAAEKLSDEGLILRATDYLALMPKRHLHVSHFVESMLFGPIYNSL